MAFLGLSSVYLMRTNLSVAIVDMIKTPPPDNNTAINNTSPPFFFMADDDDHSSSINSVVLGRKTEQLLQYSASDARAAEGSSDFCEPDDSGSSSSEDVLCFNYFLIQVVAIDK
jgi:hypothetical protein